MFEKYLTKAGRLSCKQPQEIKNQWYIQKFKQAHGETYDYSKVQYKGALEKIDIICKEHGKFSQRPSDHLRGQGCSRCYGNSTKTTKECIRDFRQVHEDTYGYDKVVYTNENTKVEIICKQHGSFFQEPNSHLKGHGCPKCQNQNQDTLYLLRCLRTGLIKIGVTGNLKQRIVNIGGNLESIYHVKLENPRQVEKHLHKKYKDYNTFNPNVNNGNTEFFDLTEDQLLEVKQFMYCLQGRFLI